MEQRIDHLLETGSTDPYYNLAYEEYVLRCRTSGSYVILWQNEKTVVIGRHQAAEAEIDRDYAERNGIRLVRRETGGGAVYHDLGNVNYSFITDLSAADRGGFGTFSETVLHALAGLGVTAEATGRNDLLVDGKKISGTAQRVLGGRILYHGTLLFDTDPAVIAAVLRPDPDKLKAKGVASVRSRVGKLKEKLPEDMTAADFLASLRRHFLAAGTEAESLTPDELGEVERLRNEKYARPEWNYGAAPRYSLRLRRRFPGGTVEALPVLRDGVIETVTFRGDFLSLCTAEPVCRALVGRTLTREALSPVLTEELCAAAFGTVTREELLELLTGAPVKE